MKAETWYSVAWMPVYDPDKSKLPQGLLRAIKVIQQGQCDFITLGRGEPSVRLMTLYMEILLTLMKSLIDSRYFLQFIKGYLI